MLGGSDTILYQISIWALPVLIAITFHEAAHGFVAYLLGDNTAMRLGRVSINPIRHVDFFGTIVLPGLLLLLRSPFLFGYAKPVPVDFTALRSPRLGMMSVAAAGPIANLLLALLAALSFHAVGLLPDTVGLWAAANLRNALLINVVLAVFNMLPLPPLDGGRILVALLPRVLAKAISAIEPVGIFVLIALIFLLPELGARFGTDLDFITRYLSASTGFLIDTILRVTGVA